MPGARAGRLRTDRSRSRSGAETALPLSAGTEPLTSVFRPGGSGSWGAPPCSSARGGGSRRGRPLVRVAPAGGRAGPRAARLREGAPRRSWTRASTRVTAEAAIERQQRAALLAQSEVEAGDGRSQEDPGQQEHALLRATPVARLLLAPEELPEGRLLLLALGGAGPLAGGLPLRPAALGRERALPRRHQGVVRRCPGPVRSFGSLLLGARQGEVASSGEVVSPAPMAFAPGAATAMPGSAASPSVSIVSGSAGGGTSVLSSDGKGIDCVRFRVGRSGLGLGASPSAAAAAATAPVPTAPAPAPAWAASPVADSPSRTRRASSFSERAWSWTNAAICWRKALSHQEGDGCRGGRLGHSAGSALADPGRPAPGLAG